ncbi:hypothetical protein SAY87_000832 [Trapa incisa]|uniref:Protein downstream neighbor of Son n=1 Tax=Trapa incisa TaxID=236973 RepID=A0AAN7GFW4_9MYRT|nr:hypothetical protein SAY87_000832 [Trapa incisa]
MAVVSGPGSLPQDSLHPGGRDDGKGTLKAGSGVRRKTPSELRKEQLKQAIAAEVVNESLISSVPSISDCGAINGLKKPGIVNPSRYIETRVDEVYPAKKSRLTMISAKENVKEGHSVDQANTLRNMPSFSWLADSRKLQFPRQESSILPIENSENCASSQKTCTQSRFRSVAEISSSAENLPPLSEIDMNKALTGLLAQKHFSPVFTVDSSETSRGPSPVGEFLHYGISPCKTIPIDLTMKKIVRVVSSSPLNGIYRSLMQQSNEPLHTSTSSCPKDQMFKSSLGTAPSFSELRTKTMHSWIYPQSTLPTSLVSVLMSSAAATEIDFFRKREFGWEESFRSLYYMLRRRACHIFYVCTSQFVVVFTGTDEPEKDRYTWNAYISRSTRGLRSLLRVNGVCFSMPLCHSKVEQIATEDLVELLEIEKYNLGQARRPTPLVDIDNRPPSLLSLTGKKNIHGLYDILLNYRTYMTFLAGEDVPTLYSPVPFCNAALSIPEVRCIETKLADYVADPLSRSPPSPGASATSVGNIIEIKDAYLPPWIVCGLCEIISYQGDFEASFVTEGTSIGLNTALEALHDLRDNSVFGIPGAGVFPPLCSGSLKSLKFHEGSYTASISPA